LCGVINQALTKTRKNCAVLCIEHLFSARGRG
jgi:hypothetical protein